MLEAVAASPATHELVEDRVGREIDPAPEEHIEVFEGDGLGVRRRERIQHLDGRRARSPVADATEVRLKVERHM